MSVGLCEEKNPQDHLKNAPMVCNGQEVKKKKAMKIKERERGRRTSGKKQYNEREC